MTPSALTSFVGRDEDVPRVLKNLRAARLVTLTGPGGVGKTRLAAEASARAHATTWFVPLAPVTDPAEVAYAVLAALGIRQPVIARRSSEPGAGPLARLAAALGDRDEVMVLDNCEHVIEAAAALAAHILAACPRMRILVTSRQPLRIDGETLCPVLPLPPPALDAPAAPVAMGEPMLALFDRDPDRAFAMFDRYSRSEDPWVRAAAPLLRATFGSMLGRMEWAESDCQAALTAFRAIGEAWGTAAVLMTLAEFAKLRGGFAAAIAALEEAAELGEDLGAWGDLSHIAGKLASVRLRAGDLAGARADLEQVERGQAERVTGPSDAKAWLSLVRAELLCREGDFAAAGRLCAEQLAWLDGKQSAWWNGTRAIVLVRLAMIALADRDGDRSRALLADALSVATDWVELPAIADVVDAIAVHAAESTALAATLLGAAHSIRGCFDEGSLDAPAVRDCLRARLGPDEFEAAYARGRARRRPRRRARPRGRRGRGPGHGWLARRLRVDGLLTA